MLAAPGAGAGRPALAHRLADLRHRRLRGRRAPGGRAGRRGSAPSTACRSPSSNLGGGFGIAYLSPATTRPTPTDVAQGLHGIVARECAAAGLAVPRLAVEPGRAIAGPGTVTLYEVGTIKQVRWTGRAHATSSGRRRDERQHPHRAVRRRATPASLASRESAAPPMLSRLVGKHCESGDIVVRDAWLPADLPRATCSRWRPPAPTAARWPATTTTCRGRRWSAVQRRRGHGSCSAGRPPTTCSAWIDG